MEVLEIAQLTLQFFDYFLLNVVTLGRRCPLSFVKNA
jgi:hypothetical protein